MDATTRALTAPEIARLGRVCGRLDALGNSDTCAIAMLEAPLWREWPEAKRRLWEYSYHLAQRETAEGTSRD